MSRFLFWGRRRMKDVPAIAGVKGLDVSDGGAGWTAYDKAMRRGADGDCWVFEYHGLTAEQVHDALEADGSPFLDAFEVP